MDIVRYYQQNIVESKKFIFIFIFLAILLRIALFTYIDDFSIYPYISNSVLGDLIVPFWKTDSWLSFILATTFALGISFYCAYINVKHTLIRVRSYLVYTIVFFVLSTHAAFLVMNMQYVSTLFFLLCIDILFGTYQQKKIANKAFSIGFVLAASSLFSFYFLFYIILFWVGFVFMRNFSIKAFIASLLGIVSIYWLILFYYLWQKDLDSYLSLFASIATAFEFGYFFKMLSKNECIVLGINVLFLLIAVSYYQLYSFLDKIRVRVMIYYLDVLAICSILSCSFVNLDPVVDLYIYAISYSLILAHFYSVAEEKWQVYLFYIFLASILIGAILISQN